MSHVVATCSVIICFKWLDLQVAPPELWLCVYLI